MKKGLIDSYEIALFGLSEKTHSFDFPISKGLFDYFENDQVENIEGQCILVLEKSETMIQLNFDISAKALLTCDRSLDTFWYEITANKNMLLKYGEEYKEIDDEVVYITPDQLKINIGQWLYELTAVEIPMKKLHPRYEDEEGEEESFIYSDTTKDEKKESNDPRWDMLKNLKIDDN